jgi:hypothetical protein
MDMATNPIIIKDSTSIVKNPREELLEEGIEKIRGNKGMIIKGFKTEKMRVEEHLRNVNFYFPVRQKIEIKKAKISQPSMRFKPRTDMERVFEAINKNAFRDMDRKIINTQLKSMSQPKKKEDPVNQADDIVDYKDALNNDESEYDDFDYLGIKKETDNDILSKIENERRLKLIKSRKMELNKQAKFLIKEFNNKTHFKGVTTLVNSNSYGKIKYRIYMI